MNEEESCLRFANVLFSVRILTSNRTWVTSFIISSKQTAVSELLISSEGNSQPYLSLKGSIFFTSSSVAKTKMPFSAYFAFLHTVKEFQNPDQLERQHKCITPLR